MNIKKIIILILAIAGFFDSSYLTITHYKHIVPPCTITRGCEAVLNSRFAEIYGIPLASLGILFFVVLIFLLFLGMNKCFKLWLWGGVGVSIILIYLQAFVLHAYCQYCLLVEAFVFGIFILNRYFNSSSK